LLEGAAFLHGETNHHPHRVGTEDGGVRFWFGPDPIFMVAEDDDAGFGTERVEHLVFLDGELS